MHEGIGDCLNACKLVVALAPCAAQQSGVHRIVETDTGGPVSGNGIDRLQFESASPVFLAKESN